MTAKLGALLIGSALLLGCDPCVFYGACGDLSPTSSVALSNSPSPSASTPPSAPSPSPGSPTPTRTAPSMSATPSGPSETHAPTLPEDSVILLDSAALSWEVPRPEGSSLASAALSAGPAESNLASLVMEWHAEPTGAVTQAAYLVHLGGDDTLTPLSPDETCCSRGGAFGDFNGDGAFDLAATDFEPSSKGSIKVISGHSLANTSAVSHASQWTLTTKDSGDSLGAALATYPHEGPGDWLLAGAPTATVGAPPAERGCVLAIQNIEPEKDAIKDALRLSDDTVTELGAAIIVVGDVDGGGAADIVVGAPGDRGAVLLFRGEALTSGDEDIPPIQILRATGPGCRAGSALAHAGDVDADGKPDIWVSAPGCVGGGRLFLLTGAALTGGGVSLEGRAWVTLNPSDAHGFPTALADEAAQSLTPGVWAGSGPDAETGWLSRIPPAPDSNLGWATLPTVIGEAPGGWAAAYAALGAPDGGLLLAMPLPDASAASPALTLYAFTR